MGDVDILSDVWCEASFEGVPPGEAMKQFQERIEFYKQAYETIDEDEGVRYALTGSCSV